MAKTPPDDLRSIDALRRIMADLRDRDGGCPWDLEQDFTSIAPYTIEEAYEVADAIRREDMTDLKEELGDLLLQVVYHAQMAEEAQAFTFEDVVGAISAKMVRRHPHVFGRAEIADADAQTRSWEQIKADERAAKATTQTPPSHLDGVPVALPALTRAEKLSKRASRAGFDWKATEDLFAKLDEETGELRAAISAQNEANMGEEAGDLLFVAVNLCRSLGIDPEQALEGTNHKFEKRFRLIEQLARESGKNFDTLSLDQQETLWQTAKERERRD